MYPMNAEALVPYTPITPPDYLDGLGALDTQGLTNLGLAVAAGLATVLLAPRIAGKQKRATVRKYKGLAGLGVGLVVFRALNR